MTNKTLESFNGDKFRAWVFSDRYALPEEETIEDVSERFKTVMPKRLHGGIDKYISTYKFVPGGRILRGLGARDNLTLFNCLALPAPCDTLLGPGGIMDTATRLATALKKGAGVGFDISKLRPGGAKLVSCGGISSGPIAFMKMYSSIVGTIQQGGTRRGALLISLEDSHPDIKQFIFSKNNDQSDIRYANISVKFKDKPNTKVLNWVAEAAWNTGEPGVLFEDKINADFGPSKVGEKFESVNACSEIPLPAWGVCCLGAINLNEFVDLDGNTDLCGIEESTGFAVDFLNAVIDHACITDAYPFKQSQNVSLKTRQIGVGVMGLAHAFIKKGVQYGSPESIDFAGLLISSIQQAAKISSQGNTSLLAGQPTGTTSIIAGTSSGIEPIFALEYVRKDGDKPIRIKDNMFKLLNGKRDQAVFKCAHEIHWRERLAVQGELQEHIDNSISSTVNLPYNTTKQTVAEIFRTSYRLGLKSITIFRDGCLRDPVVYPDGCKSGSCDL